MTGVDINRFTFITIYAVLPRPLQRPVIERGSRSNIIVQSQFIAQSKYTTRTALRYASPQIAHLRINKDYTSKNRQRSRGRIQKQIITSICPRQHLYIDNDTYRGLTTPSR